MQQREQSPPAVLAWHLFEQTVKEAAAATHEQQLLKRPLPNMLLEYALSTFTQYLRHCASLISRFYAAKVM